MAPLQKLLINSSKTALLNISTSDTSFLNFTLYNMIISHSHSSKNLGLVFYDKLSFKNHILSITKSSNFHLFRIKKIRTILSSLRYQNTPLLISRNTSKTSLSSRTLKNTDPTLLEKIVFYTNEKEYYKCPCISRYITTLLCLIA